jgi:hypothetical protein
VALPGAAPAASSQHGAPPAAAPPAKKKRTLPGNQIIVDPFLIFQSCMLTAKSCLD